MCLVAIAFGVSERHPLIVAANRDEQHARPSAPAAWWVDRPDLLGGRDLVAGGTWLGASRAGRLAAVTNVVEPGARATARSRGELVPQFLESPATAAEFAREHEREFSAYGPFRLVLFDGETLHFASNRAAGRSLERGVHVLSNNAPGTHWPKLGAAQSAVEAILDLDDPEERLFALLAERPVDAAGTRAAAPRAADSIFVVGPEFGTRCSTVVLVSRDGRLSFAERRFDSTGTPTGEARFAFRIP